MNYQGGNNGNGASSYPEGINFTQGGIGIIDKYQDDLMPQCYTITEDVESITQSLKEEAQCFHGKKYKVFSPIAYRFNSKGSKFKIKVQTDSDCIHLIGSRISNTQNELTYATEGNTLTDEL